jgi:hypothetical protein
MLRLGPARKIAQEKKADTRAADIFKNSRLGADFADPKAPYEIKPPLQTVSHEKQRTQRLRVIFFSRAFTQLTGHFFSHIPHEKHPSDTLIPNGATPESKPSVRPTGHQSQNLRPRKNAGAEMIKSGRARPIADQFNSPRHIIATPLRPRPKLDIGSIAIVGSLSMAITIPVTSGTRNLALNGDMKRALPDRHILKKSSCKVPIGQSAEQNTRPNMTDIARVQSTTAPLAPVL